MKFRDFLRILREHGFQLARQKGSHRTYKGVVGGRVRIVTVAYHHDGNDI